MQAAKQPSELKPHAELLVEAILRQVASCYEPAAETEQTCGIHYNAGIMPTLGYVAHIHSSISSAIRDSLFLNVVRQ